MSTLFNMISLINWLSYKPLSDLPC